MNIGFIGLGNMGSGMALNLLKYCQQEGHQLSVFDLNIDAKQKLIDAGAVNGESVALMAAQSNLLFTSLPSYKQIEHVAYGEQGILAHAKDGLVWFETSTNDVARWQMIIDASNKSITFMDAPVSGGKEGADAGSLSMFIGGDADTVRCFQDVLDAFTHRSIYMGGKGSGYTSKLCQLHLNYLVAQGIGEALMLGAKTNTDLNVLWNVLKHSCAQSYVVDSYIPKVLDGSYDDSFTLALASKDMNLIANLAKQLEVPAPLADEVSKNYQQAVEKYGADAPHLSIVRLLEDSTNTLLRA